MASVAHNKTPSSLKEIVFEIDEAHEKIESLIMMTRRHFPRNITKSRRVQIEEQAYREIWQHAEEIVYWFSYRDFRGNPVGTFMFDMKGRVQSRFESLFPPDISRFPVKTFYYVCQTQI